LTGPPSCFKMASEPKRRNNGMSGTKVGKKKAAAPKKALSRAQKKRRKKAEAAAAAQNQVPKKIGKDAIFQTMFCNPTYFVMFLKDFVEEK